jgi:hypothetical protein
MSKHLSITSVVVFVLMSGAVASAQDLPTYGVTGFPITPIQMSILGCSAQVQESSPAATLTVEGMPASLHQVVVLAPRTKAEEQIAGKLGETASAVH